MNWKTDRIWWSGGRNRRWGYQNRGRKERWWGPLGFGALWSNRRRRGTPRGCDGLDDIQIRTKPTTSNPTQIRFVAFDLALVETHHHSYSRNRLLFSKPDLLPLSPTLEFSLPPQTQPESNGPSRCCRYNELPMPLPLRWEREVELRWETENTYRWERQRECWDERDKCAFNSVCLLL